MARLVLHSVLAVLAIAGYVDVTYANPIPGGQVVAPAPAPSTRTAPALAPTVPQPPAADAQGA